MIAFAATDRFTRDASAYSGMIERLATRLCKGDPDLRDDLAQEGLIALWQLKRERIREDETKYVRRMLFLRMSMFVRWSRRFTRQYNPITKRWQHGNESSQRTWPQGRGAEALAGAEPEDADVDEA